MGEVAGCKTRMDRWFTSDTLERWEGVSVWVCGVWGHMGQGVGMQEYG